MYTDIETGLEWFPVLEIDAWGGDEEGSWDWNSWAYVGHVQINLDLPSTHNDIIQLMINRGFLREDCADLVEVDDDGFNLVILDKETKEPCFAIEYGSKI